MSMMFDRLRARWAIYAIELLAGWIAFSSVFSDLFLRREFFTIDSGEFDSLVEYVFRGNGFGTVSFWIRIIILLSYIGLLVLIPNLTSKKNLLRIRMYSQWGMFIGIIYAMAVFFAFGIFDASKFRWIQPAFTAIIFAIGYVRSGIELRRHE